MTCYGKVFPSYSDYLLIFLIENTVCSETRIPSVYEVLITFSFQGLTALLKEV